jgi:4-amino-4-deoxy-L-arabinose transferase-like glycosyltransferase
VRRASLLGLLLLALCAAVYVPPAALTPFFTKGEPREGLVVRHMLEEGSWVLPLRTSEAGLTIASKPPFFHWLAAAVSLLAGGVTEATIRAPSVVLGTLTVLLVWLIGRTVLPPGAALAGAVILATTLEWVRAVSTARVDGVLAALMTLALLLFYRGFVRGGLPLGEAVAAYFCLACAALTKGPVGLVLPGLVVGVALLAQRRLHAAGRFHPVAGALLILLVVGGWYLAAWQIGDEAFVEKHILKENVFRFVGASRLKSGHEHPVYYYLPTFAGGFLPWTPFLLAAVAGACRRTLRRNPVVLFLLSWIGTVFVFYSLASAKRSVYLLALYPAAALLTGHWWTALDDPVHSPRWLRSRLARGVVAAVSVAVLLPVAMVVLEGLGFAPLSWLAPLLRERDQANLPIVQNIIEDHLAITLLGLAVMLTALLSALAAVRRERWRRLFVAIATLATTLWILVFGVFQPELARRRTFGPFLSTVAGLTDGEPLYFARGTFDFGAAFYARSRTATWLGDPKPAYVLVWNDAVAKLEAAGHETTALATSEATDPKGRRRLVLVRVR